MKKIIVSILMACSVLATNAQVFQTNGDQYVVGKLLVYPTSTTSDNAYNGNIVITKPIASGQYLNLIRKGNTRWSLGTVYNSNTFAIGQGTTSDASFTAPFFTIKPTGEVGIGTPTPATLLNVVGTTGTGPTTHGLMVLGAINTTNISIDQNEIMARNNGVVSALYLNNQGGNIILNGTNTTGGNVGLGTSSPGSKLDIVGAYNNLSLRVTNDTYNDWVLQKRRSDNTQLFGIKETGSNGSMSFVTNNIDRLIITNTGTVGIGTPNPNPAYALDVNGIICANEVKVTLEHFPDFVFDSEYILPKLNDVHNYIKANGHLPNIPSATEVKKDGIGLADMQVKLLQKVEELTLYVIEQQKQIESLKSELSQIKK